MSTRCYDTDLNDAAWAWITPYLPAARSGGRPRTTDLRAVLNAIFYLLRTGCQWRLLPCEFPPWGTVYHYFRAWQNSGVWVHLHRVFYEQAHTVSFIVFFYLSFINGVRSAQEKLKDRSLVPK